MDANPPAPPPPPARTSALAIWSLVLGVGGCLFTALPAVICGHLALARIKESAGTLKGRGMAITGMIIGYFFLSTFFLGFAAAIIVPNFVRARHTVQQNACINNLRQLDTAVQQWAVEHQKQPTDIPTWNDINPYLTNQVFTCPAGGTYTLRTVAEHPTCSVPGHQLPP